MERLMAQHQWQARQIEDGGLARHGNNVTLVTRIVDHRVHTGRIVAVDLGTDPDELEELAESLMRQAEALRRKER